MSSDDEELARVKRRRILEPSPTPSESSTPSPSPSPSASPSPEPDPNADNLFLSLPVEIMDRIVLYLPLDARSTRLALIHTSVALYQRYHLDFVLDHFKEGKRLMLAYCLKDAVQGQLGWKPFSVWDASRGEFGDDELLLSLYEFDLNEYHPNRSTRDYLPLQVTDYDVQLDLGDEGDWFRRNQDREEFVDWEEIRYGLVKATPELVRSRFPCPECKGTEEVIYGSLEVARRWPSIPCDDFQFPAPCPRCTFHRETAEEYNVEMKEELEQEMWAEMEECDFEEFEEYEGDYGCG